MAAKCGRKFYHWGNLLNLMIFMFVYVIHFTSAETNFQYLKIWIYLEKKKAFHDFN